MFNLFTSKFFPISLIMKTLWGGRVLSRGNLIKAEVVMTPAKFNSGFLNAKERINIPPKLWPYKKRGNSLLACFSNTSTSICNSAIVEHPLGAPEYLNLQWINFENQVTYPNPLRSIKCTTKARLTNASAMSRNLLECSPNPWTMQTEAILLVVVGSILV